MSKSESWTQCLLTKDGSYQTAWIESRGAKVGYSVQLKETGEFWKVQEVFDTIDIGQLRTHQDSARTHRKATDI